MGMEAGGFDVVPEPVVPDESQRVEDPDKARAMAEASDHTHTEVSGRPDYKKEYPGRPAGLRGDLKVATEAADELRNDPEMAAAKRGHLDSLPVREYVADNLNKRIEGMERFAERQEEIAGIIYDLHNQDTLVRMKSEDIKQIKDILQKVNSRSGYES
jgi:hypothetical protein